MHHELLTIVEVLEVGRKGMDKDMERVYDLKSTAAPLICLKVCWRLAAKNPPIKSAILSLKGQTCCLQQNQQREEDLGTGNEPFGVRVAQMYHETLGFSLFSPSYLHLPTSQQATGWISPQFTLYLGLQHVNSVSPWISRAVCLHSF